MDASVLERGPGMEDDEEFDVENRSAATQNEKGGRTDAIVLKKKRNTTLTTEKLTEQIFPQVIRFGDEIRFEARRGSESTNVAKILASFHGVQKAVIPQSQFDDFLYRVETLGKSALVQDKIESLRAIGRDLNDQETTTTDVPSSSVVDEA